MKVVLRKYQSTDAPALLALFFDTIHNANIPDYSQEQVNAWAPTRSEVSLAWESQLRESSTIVATFNGSIVGFGNLAKDKTAIGMLYVDHRYHKKGIGKKILKKLEKKLKKSGVEGSEAEVSITARSFFERLGYQLVSDNHKVTNGVTFLNFIMKKKFKKKLEGEPVRSGIVWREVLTNKAIDLMIVILGVTIAFQLNNWKLASDSQSQEQFYLRSLLADVNSDIVNLKEVVVALESDQKAVENYLGIMDTAPADSLSKPMLAILGFETFGGSQNTYQTLVASTGLNMFPDHHMVEQVTGYYAYYPSIQRFEDIYTRLILELNRHFSAYMIYDQSKIVNPAVVLMPETRNLLVLVQGQLADGIEDYHNALKDAERLKKTLEGSIHD